MLVKSTITFLALAAPLVAALPSPTKPEVLSSNAVGAALPKRTTHVGRGTIYNQEGGTGSCGEKNPDSAVIAALSNYWMHDQSPGPYCGRWVKVTNIGSQYGVGGKGKSLKVRVEDTCPECDENHIDLSLAAWNDLTNYAYPSVIDISWHFCNVDGEC